ncbi:histidine kinase [Paenibacillus sp. sptzw28]|uniref:7TM diverse intracellular signaling domain-containing protein n=1 Tax=Paenibacillus sp. sptzw28 TaxID=715179 RepID=UPI001C6F2830|nr:7TM diverse intracellular signaling domain-containing protein [Paenibacillus sp. sptzw28]QYR23742.1 histidine kinase [Paenibacillus sp. sptzw28]
MFLFIATLFIAFIAAGCSAESEYANPSAVQGELDLRNWSFEKDGDLPLTGQWAFYERRLLPPDEAAAAKDARFVTVPKSWNSYPRSYGIADGQGYGTYRLSVLIKPTEQILGLRVPNIFSAYKLWVNGKPLAAEGMVGTNRETSRAEQFPQIVAFDGNTDRLDIVVQVSNFQHRKGGIWVDLKLGENSRLIRSQTQASAQDMVLFGSLFIIGIYHIGLYALRKQERFTIHFGLLCLFVALRATVTGDSYLVQLFPVGWEMGMKIEYISFSLSAVSGYLYIYRLFPLDASRKFMKGVVGIGVALTLFVIVSPVIVFTRTLPLFQLFVLTVSLYSLAVLIIARLRKREGSAFVLIGLAVFVATILNDMLFYNEWFVYMQLVPVGLFFFILMQSFIISTRFSSALRRVEQVSSELRELNVHLEERIEERTEALRRTNETLEQRNRELGRLERSRRHLMTNISHDLRTPITLLQGYLEAIQDGVVKSGEQQQKYIRMMLGKVVGLNRLIGDLFELAKLEAGQLRFDLSEVKLSTWMEQLRDQYEIDVRSGGHVFACEYSTGTDVHGKQVEPDRILLNLDLPRMDQVMANLIYNAIKHTEAGGKIALSFTYIHGDGRVVASVSDTGIGVGAEHLPYIFDRFYKIEISRNSADGGSGLGLAIAKEIVEAHGGIIGADSVPGTGTVLWIALPASLA